MFKVGDRVICTKPSSWCFNKIGVVRRENGKAVQVLFNDLNSLVQFNSPHHYLQKIDNTPLPLPG